MLPHLIDTPRYRVLVLLGNQVELWETTLAVIRLGAVMIPATTLLADADLRDRVARGGAGVVIAQAGIAPRFASVPGEYVRVAVGGDVPGWLRYTDSVQAAPAFQPAAR